MDKTELQDYKTSLEGELFRTQLGLERIRLEVRQIESQIKLVNRQLEQISALKPTSVESLKEITNGLR